eukprot:1707407-Rhodomonas_salina.1
MSVSPSVERNVLGPVHMDTNSTLQKKVTSYWTGCPKVVGFALSATAVPGNCVPLCSVKPMPVVANP